MAQNPTTFLSLYNYENHIPKKFSLLKQKLRGSFRGQKI
jgi:hypothetical protein